MDAESEQKQGLELDLAIADFTTYTPTTIDATISLNLLQTHSITT
jgi:hypothetical protein